MNITFDDCFTVNESTVSLFKPFNKMYSILRVLAYSKAEFLNLFSYFDAGAKDEIELY